MPKFNERLKQLRLARNYSQSELSRFLRISKSSVNMYERGEREPSLDTLEAIADFFNVDMDFLLGKSDVQNRYAASNVLPFPAMGRIPLLGAIACGSPILAQENMDGEVDLPEHIHADFALRCQGDSMINARIFDGDIVYIRHQDMVENGEIAAVLIDDEATLKRVRLFDDHISLEPENPQYRPLVFWGDEMNTVRILGKAVAFTSSIR